MKAREVMSSPVVTVTTSTGVKAAGELLCANGFTALPVVDDDGWLVGIVTEADLIRDRVPPDPRVYGSRPSHRAASPLLVGDVMTSPVESLTAGADISDAARIMVDERIRCLPIVDGGAPLGIITRRDLLRVALAHDDKDLADEISRQLARVDNPDRWSVSVQAGVADIEDFGSDAKRIQAGSGLSGSTQQVDLTELRNGFLSLPILIPANITSGTFTITLDPTVTDLAGNGPVVTTQVGSPGIVNIVPEPTSLGLVAIGGLLALRRRRVA